MLDGHRHVLEAVSQLRNQSSKYWTLNIELFKLQAPDPIYIVNPKLLVPDTLTKPLNPNMYNPSYTRQTQDLKPSKSTIKNHIPKTNTASGAP